jgi:hypothetical protein
MSYAFSMLRRNNLLYILPLVLLSTCCLAEFAVSSSSSSSSLLLEYSDDGTEYNITVGGKMWLRSADVAQSVAFHVNGQWLSVGNGLQFLLSDQYDGTDAWGRYEAAVFQYISNGEPQLSFTTSFRRYDEISAIVFQQSFGQDTQNTALPSNGTSSVMSSFPAFRVDNQFGSPMGYVAYNGAMNDEDTLGKWESSTADIPGGSTTGPFVMFTTDSPATAGVPHHASVLSSMSNFMSGAQFHNMSGSHNILQRGLLGSFTSVPNDFEYSTVLFYSDEGITAAMNDWGRSMLKRYGKSPDGPKFDLSLNGLSYYTDNGAVYYYNTKPYADYQEALLDVKQYAEQNRIPFQSIQLDSWWYPKTPIPDERGGVKNWTAMPNVFPKNLTWFFAQTGWTSTAHNRYWSPQTDYAKANGGLWDFVIESEIALPTTRAFWDFLMSDSVQWGLRTYEQDWLDWSFDRLSALHENITLGRSWLRQMGMAAAESGVTIQYCMPYPRHTLSSVELQAVTQVRSSDDYHPDNPQWKIGLSSLLAHSIGLAPSKDNFWTTTTQPNPYNLSENWPYLESAIATFSTGPVGIGDGIGYMNRDIIMKSCRDDGTLLQPSRPATMVDAAIISAATGGPWTGQLYSTFSRIGDWQFDHIIAAEMKTASKLTPWMIGRRDKSQQLVVYNVSRNGALEWAQIFSENHPIPIPVCDKSDFGVWHTSPVFPNGFAFLGELSKWVSVAPARYSNFEATPNSIRVTASGVAGESVTTVFYEAASGKAQELICKIGESGKVQMTIPGGPCQPV